MLLRALMLNPGPRAQAVPARPTTAGYFQPGANWLVNIEWDAGLNRITFRRTAAPFGGGKLAVSSGARTAVREFVSGLGFRWVTYAVGAGGLVTPALTTVTDPGAPSGWQRAAMTGGGEYLLQNGNDPQTFMAANLAGQAGQPYQAALTNVYNLGDGFAVLGAWSNGGGAGGPTFWLSNSDEGPPGVYGNGSGQRLRVYYYGATADGAGPFVRLSPGGASFLPFTGVPRPFALSGQRVDLYGVSVEPWGWAFPGGLLVPTLVSLRQFKAAAGIAQLASVTYTGVTRLTVSGAEFRALTAYGSSGTYSASEIGEGSGVFAGPPPWGSTAEAPQGRLWNVRAVVPAGYLLFHGFEFGRITGIGANGATLFEQASPFGLGSQFLAVPHLGAILGWDTNNTDRGTAISFDVGQTWAPVVIYGTSDTLGGPTLQSIPPGIYAHPTFGPPQSLYA